MKLRAHGLTWAQVTTEMGAVPVTLTAAELYEALQRGTIEGGWTAVSHAVPAKIYEVSKSVLRFDTGYVFDSAFTIRKDIWDSLPNDLKTIMKEEAVPAEEALYDAMIGSQEQKNWEIVQKANVKVIDPSPAEMEALAQKLQPKWREWAKAGGPQTEALLDAVLKEAAR
jgi:TRAP-type C4-dicarboxylate transport system substrate-binding protein